MKLTEDFKNKVVAALIEVRLNYGGSDAAFAKQQGINGSVWSRLKNGETEGLLSQSQWLNIGRELNVSVNENHWNMVETEVYEGIKNDIEFCQTNSKGMVLVDDCAIGKTYSAKYLSKNIPNCFYVDGSQCKTKQLFIRALAKAIGVESTGRLIDVKANTKYYLKMLVKPVVIIDEAGDLRHEVFLELKEFWNHTEGTCGWYMMGADALRAVIERGIAGKKPGYRELLSRYSDKFMNIVPLDRHERIAFYKKLISDVLRGNMRDHSKLDELVKKCLTSDADGEIGGLRKAETLLILNAA